MKRWGVIGLIAVCTLIAGHVEKASPTLLSQVVATEGESSSFERQFRETMAEIARGELGNDDPAKYMPKGYKNQLNYCAAFVSYVLKDAFKKFGIELPFTALDRIRVDAQQEIFEELGSKISGLYKKLEDMEVGDLKTGDILYWKPPRNHALIFIGLYTHDDGKLYLEVIEGNSPPLEGEASYPREVERRYVTPEGIDGVVDIAKYLEYLARQQGKERDVSGAMNRLWSQILAYPKFK